jgi:hypothetical protein
MTIKAHKKWAERANYEEYIDQLYDLGVTLYHGSDDPKLEVDTRREHTNRVITDFHYDLISDDEQEKDGNESGNVDDEEPLPVTQAPFSRPKHQRRKRNTSYSESPLSKKPRVVLPYVKVSPLRHRTQHVIQIESDNESDDGSEGDHEAVSTED